jgi:hypothetical protein
MDFREHSELHPLLEPQMARRARTKLVRQRLPLAPRLQPIEDPRHHDARSHGRAPTFRFRPLHGDQRLDTQPQRLGNVGELGFHEPL